MAMPKVSIIVPSYNHGRFLRQRLDSILQQTCQDFEVFVLDDASTDNTREVLAEYAARIVKHLAHRVLRKCFGRGTDQALPNSPTV